MNSDSTMQGVNYLGVYPLTILHIGEFLFTQSYLLLLIISTCNIVSQKIEESVRVLFYSNDLRQKKIWPCRRTWDRVSECWEASPPCTCCTVHWTGFWMGIPVASDQALTSFLTGKEIRINYCLLPKKNQRKRQRTNYRMFKKFITRVKMLHIRWRKLLIIRISL